MVKILEKIKNNQDFNNMCFYIGEFDGNLVAAPCESNCVGYEPDYSRAIVLKNDFKLKYKGKTLNDKFGNVKDNFDGLFYRKTEYGYTISPVEDTFDCLWIYDDYSIDNYIEFINEICGALEQEADIDKYQEIRKEFIERICGKFKDDAVITTVLRNAMNDVLKEYEVEQDE